MPILADRSSIVIVHILANDASGGTQSRTLGYVRALSTEGCDQAVVFCSPPTERSSVRDRLVAHGADIHYIPLDKGLVRFAVRLCVLLNRYRVSAVLTHGLGLHAVVAPVAWLARAKRIVVLVGNPVPANAVDIGVLRRRSRFVAAFVDLVVPCSDFVAQSIVQNVRIDERVVQVIYNPMDVAQILFQAEVTRLQREPGDRVVLCTVARLDSIKDHHVVIRAVAELVARGRRVELRIVGSGPSEPHVRELVATLGICESVKFVGDRNDVPALLGGSDVFVYGMTWNEGFGIAVAEAMAARTPIVCTDAGPASEVLVGGVAGLLVPPGDSFAMANAVELLLDDAELRKQLVEEASRVASIRHDLDHLRDSVRAVVAP